MKTKISDKEFFAAINRIIDWAKPRASKSAFARCALVYAENVGRAGIEFGRSGIATQISYILCNLNAYTGLQARADKILIQEFRAQLSAEEWGVAFAITHVKNKKFYEVENNMRLSIKAAENEIRKARDRK